MSSMHMVHSMTIISRYYSFVFSFTLQTGYSYQLRVRAMNIAIHEYATDWYSIGHLLHPLDKFLTSLDGNLRQSIQRHFVEDLPHK